MNQFDAKCHDVRPVLVIHEMMKARITHAQYTGLVWREFKQLLFQCIYEFSFHMAESVHESTRQSSTQELEAPSINVGDSKSGKSRYLSELR